MTHPYFVDFITSHKKDLTDVVTASVGLELSVPCFSAAIDFLNGYTHALSSANVIQGQRDYFGAHTYKRNDDPENKSHHTIW